MCPLWWSSKRLVVAGVFLAVALAGCSSAETVMMQNPQTHEVARCPEGYRGFIDGTGYRRQEDCISDYERKGFQRSTVPPSK
jgi:hypothetical protein